MTNDQPAGEALLDAARRLLLDELLALLPAERRYDGLMIANAMAIAGRELRDAGAASAAAARRLSAFYDDATAMPEPPAPSPRPPQCAISRGRSACPSMWRVTPPRISS